MRWTERKTTGENRGGLEGGEGGEEQVGGTLPGGKQGGREVLSGKALSWSLRQLTVGLSEREFERGS